LAKLKIFLFNKFIFSKKMKSITSPTTAPEKRECIETFFPCFSSDLMEASVRAALNKHNYADLGKNQGQRWLDLDSRLSTMLDEARSIRQERDLIWDKDLNGPLSDARKIVTIFNELTPWLNKVYGFPEKTKTVKKVPTEKSVETHLKRAAATTNAINEAKAFATAKKEAKANIQKSAASASVTSNDSTRVVVA
jgi:hypothetical protein